MEWLELKRAKIAHIFTIAKIARWPSHSHIKSRSGSPENQVPPATAQYIKDRHPDARKRTRVVSSA